MTSNITSNNDAARSDAGIPSTVPVGTWLLAKVSSDLDFDSGRSCYVSSVVIHVTETLLQQIDAAERVADANGWTIHSRVGDGVTFLIGTDSDDWNQEAEATMDLEELLDMMESEEVQVREISADLAKGLLALPRPNTRADAVVLGGSGSAPSFYCRDKYTLEPFSTPHIEMLRVNAEEPIVDER